jgi:hypothetical protein
MARALVPAMTRRDAPPNAGVSALLVKRVAEKSSERDGELVFGMSA